MNKAPKRERQNDSDATFTTTSLTPSIVESCSRIKKEKIQLSREDADNLYFIDLKADIEIQTRSVSDRYMPNKSQEKDMMCIRSVNRDGKLVLIQIWDNRGGIHARLMEKLLRLYSAT